MALNINTNVASLNAQRVLTRNQSALQTSFQRLSSGLRINSASDDAAGLAIGERMGAQVRGLNQAIRNANDASAVAKTAEGALVETTSILQRMRELAVQSANDTNTTTDRSALQLEATALQAELDRIGSQTQYNGLNLLDGSFTGKNFQVGANAGQSISLDIERSSSAALGAVASVSTANAVAANALGSGDLVVNGVTVGAASATDDTASSTGNANSAIAKAAAINAVAATSGVSATVTAASITDNQAVAAGTFGAGDLLINGVDIGAVTAVANDSDSALRNAINAVSSQTGVEATVDGSNQLVLTSADGRNIDIAGADPNGSTPVLGTLGAAQTQAGGISLESDAAISIAGTAPGDAGLTAASTAVNTAVNISSQTISTQTGANTAIGVFDSAIRQVSSQRAGLGAFLNRLDSAVANLSTTSENVSAARSQVMDADFAAETALFARNQILQQASAAMLAQANTTGQVALQLLNG
jgi:flagellin